MDELGAVQDAVFTADIDDPDYVEPEDDDNKDDDVDDDNADDSADDKTDDDKPDELSELKTTVERLQSEIEDKSKEINRLGYALRKGTKAEPKDDKETPFTKTQLLQLYKEHADNPEVVFQILEEMTKQGNADATAAAEKSFELKTRKTQMDSFIENIYPDAFKEGSELHGGVQQAIEWAHLEGHPLAEHLALGLLTIKNLPEHIEKIKKEAKEEALKTKETDLAKKAEDARQKNIDSSKPSKSGSSDKTKTVTLNAQQMDTAKRLGFTTKAQIARYAKMVGKKSETMHSEA
jgi:hypothetical protein